MITPRLRPKLPKLVGIHGHAGAGKDTLKELICVDRPNFFFYSFADPLKEAAAVAFGIPLSAFYNPETKELPNHYWGITPRVIAQFLGTEMFRECIPKLMPGIGDSFWVERMEMRLSNCYVPEDEGLIIPTDTVVIPDVRFQNEYDWIIANEGIIIHLTRPGFDGTIGIPGHSSESKLNLHTPERTYEIANDGLISDLEQKLKDLNLFFPPIISLTSLF